MNRPNRPFSTTILVAFVAIVSLCFASQHAYAEVRIYTIDPAQSSISISGTVPIPFVGTMLEEQEVGSLTTSYSGTIKTERGLDTIQFIGGSSIDANLLLDGNQVPVSFAPAVGGGNGSAPADYAAEALGGFYAGRDFLSDLLNGSALMINAGTFDLSTTSLQFIDGTIDYNVGSFNIADSRLMAGESALVQPDNQSGSLGSLSIVGSVETLTIPINATFLVNFGSQEAPQNASLVFTGQLVATVPEPSAIGLGILAASGAAGFVWRSRRGQKSL